MREDIKLKKYRMLYKNINDHYCNDFLNVKQSCEKEGITPSTYYKICSTLNKRSVGTDKKKEDVQDGGNDNKKNKKKTVSKSKANDHISSDTKPHEKRVKKMNSKQLY